MPADLTGVIAPVLTPIEDGEVALDRVADVVDFTIDCGCHAVVAAGTGAQETVGLSVAERKELQTATVDAVDGRVPVLGGVSYPALPVVRDLVDHAERAGADALLAMPPWGIDPGQDGIVDYYRELAAAAERPVLAYNNPGVTTDMTKETIARVTAIDGIAYTKESSRDWQKIAWLLEHVHHDGRAKVFTTMDVLAWTLAAGGEGAIAPAPLTRNSIAIWEAHEVGDLATAAARQQELGGFPPDGVDGGLLPVCKAATELAGVDVGPPRPPYDPVVESAYDPLETWLRDHEILDD